MAQNSEEVKEKTEVITEELIHELSKTNDNEESEQLLDDENAKTPSTKLSKYKT